MKRWIHANTESTDDIILENIHCINPSYYGGFVNDKVWSGTRDELIQKVVYDNTFQFSHCFE